MQFTVLRDNFYQVLNFSLLEINQKQKTGRTIFNAKKLAFINRDVIMQI